MQHLTLHSSDGRTILHAAKWAPEGTPIAVLQIAHGMVEYIERYDAFARFMCAQGFLVVGHDHIGHGASIRGAGDWGHFADKDGFTFVVEDIKRLHAHIASEYPQLPYFLLGHSMGSFAVRNVLLNPPEDLCGALILGTGNQSPALLRAGKQLAGAMCAVYGPRHRSKLLTYLALGSLNRPFREEGLENAFLTRDQHIVYSYNAEPRCSFRFTAASYQSMFTAMLRLHDAQALSGMPRELPLFVASGMADPLGGMGKDIKKLAESYQALGVRDVTLKLYPDCRHELLNELDRETIYADILAWLKAHING